MKKTGLGKRGTVRPRRKMQVALHLLSVGLCVTACTANSPGQRPRSAWLYSPYAPGSQPNPMRIDVTPNATEDHQNQQSHAVPATRKIDTLRKSSYRFEQLVSRILADQQIPAEERSEKIGCNSAIAHAIRPADAIARYCAARPNGTFDEIRPGQDDLSRGYYLDCAATLDLLAETTGWNVARSVRPPSVAGPTNPMIDPLMLDFLSMEIEAPNLVVHVEFNGPRRCTARILIAVKD